MNFKTITIVKQNLIQSIENWVTTNSLKKLNLDESA